MPWGTTAMHEPRKNRTGMGPAAGSILLVCAVLASGSGCQVLGIPSYRSDCADGYSDLYVSTASDCPPGALPPMPGFLRRWHAKKHLPDAPDSPRFHPLPTRPMFSPRPDAGENNSSEFYPGDTSSPTPAYGHFPSADY